MPEADPACDEVDTDFDYPTRRTVSAAEAERPITRAVPSVFGLAESQLCVGRTGSSADPARSVIGRRDDEATGVTIAVGARYPSDRWTSEREEHERRRRAKQKPPRPVKGFRTKGRKLAALLAGAK